MNLSRNLFRSAALGLAFVATAAVASVTFNPVNGIGFVGKGDVQSAFGWNNAALQANVGAISFTYESQVTYKAVCFWTTGEGTNGQRDHLVTHNRNSSIAGTVNHQNRTQQQVNGINLTGFGETVTSGGEVPVVGGPCPGNQGHGGIWIDVSVVEGSGAGGLYVWYDGVKVLLGNF